MHWIKCVAKNIQPRSNLFFREDAKICQIFLKEDLSRKKAFVLLCLKLKMDLFLNNLMNILCQFILLKR